MGREKRLGFARLLRDWRGMMAEKGKGMRPGVFTQEEAAALLGVHAITYCRWENARITIRWYNYENVMAAMADTAEGGGNE